MIELSPEILTIIMFGGVLVFAMTGFPMAFVLGSVAFLTGLLVFGGNITIHILYTRLFELSLNYPYLAVPLFTFMGVILQHSGIAEKLYDALYEWLSGFKGGLAVVTVIAGTILAACLGTITASVTLLTLIALGPMIKRGYDKSLATGSVIAAGTLGILIPPSIMIVVYGPQAGVSVGKMFMGAIFPGLLLSVLYNIYITVRCYLNPKLGPPIPEEERHKISSIKKLIKLFKAIAPTLLIILAVLGTIYTGIAPPTEAAAMGSFAVVILAIVYRKFTWSLIKHSAIEVLRVSAFVLLIAGLSYAFVGIFMSAGCGEVVTNLIMAVPGGKWGAFLMIMFIVFVLGMFIEWIGIVFIVVPIFSPIFVKLGFDPLWAAMMICVDLQMAFMTPPMAMSIFVCRGTAPPELGVTMSDIIKGVIPFIIIIMIALILCTIFPQIITWLPERMIGPS
ncbi:MAG: C4-dicarboxylate ABC transporter [Candidatus Infernicultor aquiphilus]|uniref:C4-dicarboxylate ABC transporter n=1 Tax=Candidatus Infernicultor aquiphilus TaxID=1805029 RepID=A0A2M7K9Q9_9BACT|nr:MAG: C4-dicarboxylate ABC transporter [Candidatus Atribacteria bacterium CG_4_8_14_3_um_filter_34_18]PIY33764.1 MAG: C4-dicarboxylate ABC transporter [Candidatus Atribacteria bacterium CG_4_10_14_3_um_filter_34_13]